jgi:uncharacterized protein YjiS (DUF1127 family)
MMQSAASIKGSQAAQSELDARAILKKIATPVRYCVSLIREAAAHERDRRQVASLDACMLRDIGLEPFDVYRGWHRSGR